MFFQLKIMVLCGKKCIRSKRDIVNGIYKLIILEKSEV